MVVEVEEQDLEAQVGLQDLNLKVLLF